MKALLLGAWTLCACQSLCGAFLLPPIPGSGCTWAADQGGGAACLRMGGQGDNSLESLAKRLEKGMNTWSEPAAADSLPPKKQAQAAQQRGPAPPAGPTKSRDEMVVRVSATRAGKGGKTVTEVTGMESMPKAEARTVLKMIKEKISVGGRVTDEMVLEIQGDQVEKVVKILLEEGFPDTKQSGGTPSKKKGLK